MTEATLSIRVNSTEIDKGKRSLDDLARSGSTAEKATDGVTKSTKGLGDAARLTLTFLAPLVGAMSARQVIQYADAWRNAENQLRLVTKSSSDLANVQKQLVGLSNETRASFDSTATLFSRLTRATSDMGLSQQEVIGLTKTINQSFAVSGASAEEAAGAIRQLSQGLAAGALRGDEFNSVAEQAPGIMRAIADSLQMTVGDLRNFAAEGGITAEIVVNALKGASESIDKDFTSAVVTFGQSMVIARTNAMEFVGTSEGINKATDLAGKSVVLLSENLEHLDVVSIAVASTFATKLIPASIGMLGPVGLLAAAVGTLVIAYRNLQDATESAEQSAVDGWAKNGLATLEHGMNGLVQQINAVEEKLQGHFRNNQDRNELLLEQERLYRQLNMAAAARAALVADETDGTEQLSEQEKEWLRILKDLNDENSELAKSIAKVTKETQKNSEAVSDLIVDLRNQLAMTDKTEREQFILTEVMKLGTAATIQQRMAVLALASALWEQEQALEAAENAEKAFQARMEEAAKSIADAEREAARQSAEEWREFRDDFSDIFSEMVSDADSATDAIVDSFKRMGGKIVGDLIASGVMNVLNPGAGGFSLSGTLANAGTAGTITNALLGATSVGFGASQVGVLSGAAAGVGNSMIAPATAQAALGSGLTSTLTALATNPLTWAVAALAIAAKNDFWKDPDNYKRSFAGMLVGPTPGADPASVFSVNAFASGFKPQGIAHNADRQTAEQYIDVYRELDQSIVDLTNKLGGFVDLSRSTLAGTGIDGRFGTSGTFLGLGGKTTDADIAGMTSSYVMQLARHITGLDQELMDAVQSASTAEEVIALLSDAVAEVETESAAAAKALEDAAQSITKLTDAQQSALNVAVNNIRMIRDLLNENEIGGNAATQRINEIATLREQLLDAYDEELSAARELHSQNIRNYEQQLRLAQNIDQGLAGILTGDSSALSTGDKLAFAQSRFNNLIAAAMGGDENAGGQLVGAGQSVISLAREMFASSGAFKQIFNSVTGQLSNAQSAFSDTKNPGDFAAPSRAGLDNALYTLDKELAGIRDSIAIDTISQLAQLNLRVSQLPAGIAAALQGIISSNPSAGSYNPDVNASDISAYIATLPNTPDGARQAIQAAQANGIGSQQLAASIQGLYPGVTQQEILDLASSLNLPQFASGGVSTGPQSGYPVIMHGTETVIPGDMSKVMGEVAGLLREVVKILFSDAQFASGQRNQLVDAMRSIDRKINTRGGGSSAYVA